MEKVAASLNTIFKGIRPIPGHPRTMKYPYTMGAQIAHFPYKFYWDHCWNYKYYWFGCIAALPVFIYINGMANSPENVAKLKEIRRKEAEEHH